MTICDLLYAQYVLIIKQAIVPLPATSGAVLEKCRKITLVSNIMQ